MLFVLTRRDKPERPAADALLADLAGRGVEVAEVELGPLSQAEVAAVARSVADLTEAAVEQVVRAADGNPLLAVASARALAAGRGAPPRDLWAAVRAAAGRLTRAARDLVEVLAAAGAAPAHHRTGRAGQADGGVLMPGFELNTHCRGPVEEVWKLLFDPDRFRDWWAGIEAVRKDAPACVGCIHAVPSHTGSHGRGAWSV